MKNYTVFKRNGIFSKTIVSIFFILYSCSFLYSQDRPSNSSLNVFITPSAIFNLYPGVQGGLEYKFNNDWSVFTEFGAIIPARLSYSEVNSSEYSGFRIKGGLRKRIYKAFFMELNYYHRRVEHSVTTDFFRFNRLYIEEMNFTVNNVMNGLAITAGVEIKMGNRWVWDIGGGVGPGVQDRIFSELPQDVEEIDRSFLWRGINFRRNNIKNEFFPVIVMNARLKYRIF